MCRGRHALHKCLCVCGGAFGVEIPFGDCHWLQLENEDGLPCRGRSRDLSAHLRIALANNNDVDSPAKINQASAVVVPIFGDDSSGEHASHKTLALLDQFQTLPLVVAGDYHVEHHSFPSLAAFSARFCSLNFFLISRRLGGISIPSLALSSSASVSNSSSQ